MAKQTPKTIVRQGRPGSYSTHAFPEPGYVVRDPFFCEVIGKGMTAQAAWADALNAVTVAA